MTIYWPTLYGEEIVEYIPESLITMTGCTALLSFIAEPTKTSKILRTLKLASLTFTGALASMTTEHYMYKYFLHNPIPTKTRNTLLHASIGSALGNIFLGLSFAKCLSIVGIDKVPYLFVTFIIVGVNIGKTYADYLYDNNFYDKQFYRIIIRNHEDQDTISRLKLEQSSKERIQQQKIEMMLQKHHAVNSGITPSTSNPQTKRNEKQDSL